MSKEIQIYADSASLNFRYSWLLRIMNITLLAH